MEDKIPTFLERENEYANIPHFLL